MQTMVSTAGAALANALSAQRAESDELPPGATAGPWIVERELGRGGMGSVYAVTHSGIGKKAALKVMHRRLLASSSAERILLEARVVNQVGHPNIVDIFETGTLADGRPYIVMERLEGVPLSQRADESKILPDQVIGILLQVCDALLAAHAASVVHRDLKLENVFLIDNADEPTQPRVKLLDWGIAKDISSADARVTIEGQLVGTPQYLSPEQARGGVVTPQTDVYSLGVMAFELFLEQLPFEAETSAEIMAMHIRATPPSPRELWPDIPPGLEHLLLAMLEKDPQARPTVLTVAHTLEILRTELHRRRDAYASQPGKRAEPGEQTQAAKAQSRVATGRRVVTGRRPLTPKEGLAPTELVEAWPPRTNRRWHVAVGALAITASAFLFLFTRETDKAEAAGKPSRAAAVATGASALATPDSPVDAERAATSIAATHSAATDAPVVAATDAPVVAATDAPVVAAPAAADAASAATPGKAPRRTSIHARKAQVKPHLSLSVDPDGTLDPYR